MKLYLIRHGQSQGNAEIASRHNVPLTKLGREQIRRSTEVLAEQHFDVLYCSPLDRALQTATILYSRLHITPYAHPFFSEVGFSWGEKDATRKQLQSSYPVVTLDASIGIHRWAPADHETEDEAFQRAGKVIDFILERHPDPNACVLIVSHGRFGSILIGYLFGVHPCGYARFSQNNGGISLVRIVDDEIKLRFQNATAHLPGKLLT